MRIFCVFHSNPYISYSTISYNNSGINGGGIYITDDSSPVFNKCKIAYNISASFGGGIYCYDFSYPVIYNSTITANTASPYGGGIYCYSSSFLEILNTIVEGNFGDYGLYLYNLSSSSFNITHSDFYNNEGGNFNILPPGVGQIITTNANGDSCDQFYNIFMDPLFYSNTGDSAFYLTANSPCIDAGDPLSPLDPDSTIADMGAYYYDQGLWVKPFAENQPQDYSINAYPNPFNQRVALDFALPSAAPVKLTVFDISGREVAMLVDGYQTAGNHEVIFNAKELVSGVYFVRLTVDSGQSMVRKMVLMK